MPEMRNVDQDDPVEMLTSSRKQQGPLNIVVTGCNSGIGLQACKLLRKISSDHRLFLASRTREKAEHAANEILSASQQSTQNDHSCTSDKNTTTAAPAKLPVADCSKSKNDDDDDDNSNLYPMVCDHTSLNSVRMFCNELKSLLETIGDEENLGGPAGIDVLCLNAAILLGEDTEAEFTEDDIELTMQTNHFAPYLIGNLLFDDINAGGRVVVTSSGLHAFASFGDFKGVVVNEETGKIDGRKFSMLDGKDYDHKNCYAISKLCNSAFCAAMDKRLRRRNAIAVSFTPGLIPTSGLFRRQKLFHETMCNKETSGMVETEEWGGILLAWMILSDEVGKEGGKYWRAPFGVSRRGGRIPDDIYAASMNGEAEDVKNQEILWRISAEITGLQESKIAVTVG
mmetsp:Transcript_52779/g.127942  ORF Transcript_52779/g.127942 Transcript_52779/m.127942 type:complete len:398 (-) Transcript_52779:29-1222(-)